MGEEALVELKSAAIVDGWCRRVAKARGPSSYYGGRVDDP